MGKSEPEHRIETREQADAWLSRASELESQGDKLIFRIAEPVLETHRDRFRSTFPRAVLRPIPPRQPYTLDRPVAYDGPPRRVPKDFRTLPPSIKVPEKDPPGGGYTTTWIGSGVPAPEHPYASDWYSRCMHCASTDTRILHASCSVHIGRVETSSWYECEYECLECGKFNYHQRNYED